MKRIRWSADSGLGNICDGSVASVCGIRTTSLYRFSQAGSINHRFGGTGNHQYQRDHHCRHHSSLAVKERASARQPGHQLVYFK